MATVLITGGTGLIGTALTQALIDKGYNVIVLTRDPSQQRASKNKSFAQWNIKDQTIDRNAIIKADYIVHLAGANVAEKRWTDKRKLEIIDSRTKSAALLVKALKDIPNTVKAVISASAIGWYGPDPEIPNPHPFTENAPANSDFLGTTCQQWEESIGPVISLGKRLVILRTGIVLSNEDGAYAEFKKPIKFGIAPILGSGRQVVSWIHITDMVRMYIEAIENEQWNGIYNAVTPVPVNNKTLITTIAKSTKSFYLKVPVPAFALKAALGEMSIEVLKSCTVSAKKVEHAGFQFFFSNIETAVNNLK
ncbi:MAG: TIGR01777 family protein [Chitinophagaceae bacterium]